ncbi:hypothetical protein N181_18480 [Sinorhizobium fredii USDA 205]|uniref:Uncharacterized protein n=2 Tax=Rhizobium fredii TaxID=380 RepID=A0A844AGJ5_RHIFR|nr:hypothetical protein N181_18480 [Sinorhizobium fredii USDA 205]MQW93991.1 hypothetical protein [Sinorhizobium fredii]MQX11242.1 hypothetical protein [Sinorhizobium fredii]UTY50403.1 hypothetical protein EPK84_28425 [Sinorhizobium fredii]GEC32454.1 hypothetical protein EFR01_26250 [Sinorhizobium fredii]
MSLVRVGRARLAMALPRFRKQLLSVKSRKSDDLFEAYALAARTLEKLHLGDQPELLAEYETTCLQIQAEVLRLLGEGERCT